MNNLKVDSSFLKSVGFDENTGMIDPDQFSSELNIPLDTAIRFTDKIAAYEAACLTKNMVIYFDGDYEFFETPQDLINDYTTCRLEKDDIKEHINSVSNIIIDGNDCMFSLVERVVFIKNNRELLIPNVVGTFLFDKKFKKGVEFKTSKEAAHYIREYGLNKYSFFVIDGDCYTIINDFLLKFLFDTNEECIEVLINRFIL